ncbi:hypothetical protein BMAPRL20_A1938 [Burkholderia mallei PRL-20]|nr:hypothetical protein BMAPRL20_A1938 [Burkholderia mallei PRL-20]
MPAVPARDYPRARRAANHPGATRGRASGIGHRASGIGRRASASGVGRRASGVGRRASGVGRRASGVGRRASGVGRRASGVGRRASGARRPARARVIKSRSTRQRAAQAALARSSGRRTQRQTHC